MRALWLENNRIDFRDVPGPQNPNEALIRLRLAGICGTEVDGTEMKMVKEVNSKMIKTIQEYNLLCSILLSLKSPLIKSSELE